MRRPLAFAAATAAATVLVAFPAAAHVSVTPSDAAAGGYATLAFSVPHGCDGESTNTIEVAIPAGVVSVKPEFVAGWDATTEIGPYDEPVELHGDEITEGAVAVTWTAQDDAAALPDDQFRTFGITMKLPDAEPGTELPFPTVQGCVDGRGPHGSPCRRVTRKWTTRCPCSRSPPPRAATDTVLTPRSRRTAKTWRPQPSPPMLMSPRWPMPTSRLRRPRRVPTMARIR